MLCRAPTRSTPSTTSSAPTSSATWPSARPASSEVASLREAVGARWPRPRTAAPSPELRDRVLAGSPPSVPCLPSCQRRRRPTRSSASISGPGRRGRRGHRVGPGGSSPGRRSTTTQLSRAQQVLAADDAKSVHQTLPQRGEGHGHRRPRSSTGPSSRPRTCRPRRTATRTPSGSSTTSDMVPAGIMPQGEDNTVLLSGDAATADGAGISVEDRRRGPRRARGRGRRTLRVRGLDPMTALRLGSPSSAPGSPASPRRTSPRGPRTSPSFEADDRLGGHADTHPVGPEAARHRHRLHRPQPAHLPGAAADVRRARRRDPAVGDVDVDPRRRHRPGVGRRARPARPVPDDRQPAQPALPGDAAGDPALPRAGPGKLLAADGHRRHAARVPRRRPLLGVLRPALHGAAGRRRLVVRPGGRARLPGPLPVHVPPAPRDARHLRQPAVAHGHRRLAGLRREGRRGASGGGPHRHQGHLGPGDRRPASRSPTATAR